eukprot:scaffold2903_cov336-Prasinococcus_capsulatus_cf.AAC.8
MLHGDEAPGPCRAEGRARSVTVGARMAAGRLPSKACGSERPRAQTVGVDPTLRRVGGAVDLSEPGRPVQERRPTHAGTGVSAGAFGTRESHGGRRGAGSSRPSSGRAHRGRLARRHHGGGPSEAAGALEPAMQQHLEQIPQEPRACPHGRGAARAVGRARAQGFARLIDRSWGGPAGARTAALPRQHPPQRQHLREQGGVHLPFQPQGMPAPAPALGGRIFICALAC